MIAASRALVSLLVSAICDCLGNLANAAIWKPAHGGGEAEAIEIEGEALAEAPRRQSMPAAF